MSKNFELDENEVDSQKDKFLTFSIENVDYGVEIVEISEIIGMQKITSLPDVPNYIKGIVNLRGQIFPVIDIRQRFNLKSKPYDNRTCIIVAKTGSQSVGLIVDSVNEVVVIPEADRFLPSQIDDLSKQKFVKGMGKIENSIKIILDLKKVVGQEVEEVSVLEIKKAA